LGILTVCNGWDLLQLQQLLRIIVCLSDLFSALLMLWLSFRPHQREIIGLNDFPHYGLFNWVFDSFDLLCFEDLAHYRWLRFKHFVEFMLK
jgi:hypothetical protein